MLNPHNPDAATPQAAIDWASVEFTTYCPDGSNNCVQYAKQGGRVAVRSSQTPGKIAELTDAEWDDFVTGVRSGAIA